MVSPWSEGDDRPGLLPGSRLPINDTIEFLEVMPRRQGPDTRGEDHAMRLDRRHPIERMARLAILLGVAPLTLAGVVSAQNPNPNQGQGQAQAQEAPPAARPREVPQLKGAQQGDPQVNTDEEAPPGGLRLPPENPPGEIAEGPAADPLGPAAMPADAARPPAGRPADPNMPIVPQWPFRYELTIASFDGAPLAVRYYPSQLGAAAPVVLLVHDLGPGRSSQDFDAAVADLEGQGIATHLQELEYAVLAVDLRGHGQSPSRSRGTVGNPLLRWIGDLQASYRFLLDRHNRRELNLAKFAVVALGDGANLAAHWASAPGGAVSIEGRTSDLAAMVLISPRPTLNDRPIEPAVTALAPRLPILLQAGAGDAERSALVDALRPTVERQRLSRVALTETRLPATNLLRFAPEATTPLIEFLDSTVKVRADEWEPRYNLDPVVYTNVRVTNLGAEGEAEAQPAAVPRRPQPPAEANEANEGDGPGRSS